MSGLKLKSGADFCNLEAFRMRLHNKGEDPTSDFGDGQIYFNTSDTSVGSARHVRLYDGTNFRSLAYLDEIAKNEEFLALKDRVDLLSGDVDTDNLINNLKDLEEFLRDFDETDKLKSLLDGKLNTSGGTIEGALTISSGSDKKIILNNTDTDNKYQFISFRQNGVEYGTLGTNASDDLVWGKEGAWKTILTSAGGTIDGSLAVSSGTISSLRTSTRRAVFYKNASESVDSGTYIVDVSDSGDAVLKLTYNDLTWKGNTLLHSGNVGEYALKRVNNVTSLDNVNAGEFFFSAYQATNRPATNFAGGATFQIYKTSGGDEYRVQLAFGTDANGYIRGYNGTTWTSWKTIAFTDSYENITFANETGVAGTTVEGKKHLMLYLSNANNLLLGYHTTLAGLNTKISGKNVYLNYGENHTTGLLLNSSGNVTIGASDLAGTSTKLYVDGDLVVGKSATIGVTDSNDKRLPALQLNNSNNLLLGQYTAKEGYNTVIYGNEIRLCYSNAGTSSLTALLVNSSGNVGIGTTTPSARLDVNGNILMPNYSALMSRKTDGTAINLIYAGNDDIVKIGNGILPIKLQGNTTIGGDLHVTGNIIADGEVSAGGRAEEGGNAGSGAGAFHSESIAVGATQTTIAHGLGTDDIVVSIYEKDGVSGRWSLILTDVEVVDANNIIVSFGSATSVEHKVVIMGAVA